MRTAFMIMLVSAVGSAACGRDTSMSDLQMKAVATGSRLSVTWTNTGQAPLRVATHVFAGEKHFDWLTVTLTSDSAGPRTLVFRADRDESGAVFVDLAPGAEAAETIDLAAWALRKVNREQALAPGHFQGRVVYDTGTETRGWQGRLEAPFVIDVP